MLLGNSQLGRGSMQPALGEHSPSPHDSGLEDFCKATPLHAYIQAFDALRAYFTPLYSVVAPKSSQAVTTSAPQCASPPANSASSRKTNTITCYIAQVS